jgi:phage shock protein PspC (stress-responsive transcriptional regulator)
MKKVINITLGGLIFAIEQDAYDILAEYLSDIKSSLSNTDDDKEVVSDIETAIAEKFSARKRSEKTAVVISDVQEVIIEMGSPADFGEQSTESTTENNAQYETKKGLYRDTDDAIIAGVASGIARYFDVDPVIVRLAFAVSIFFSGIGILAYIILWLIVPAAKTTSEKYAMRGEKVTLKEITEQVKKNLKEINTTDLKEVKGIWKGIRSILVKLFEAIRFVVRILARILRYVVGIVFLVGGSLGIAGLVSLYTIIILSDKAFFPSEVQIALSVLMESAIGTVAMLSSFVMMTIPLLVLVLTGAGVLAKRNLFTVVKATTLAVIWIVAATLAITASVLQVEKVMQKLDGEGFRNDTHQPHINPDDSSQEIIDTQIRLPEEEEVESLPPTAEPIGLPEGDEVVVEPANIES